MKEIFNLTKWTIIDAKAWVIIVVALLLMPWACPYLAPTQEERDLFMPALAQGAWQTLWWAGTLILITQAANIGYQYRKFGTYDYFTSKKVKKSRIIIGSTLPQIIMGAILGLIPMLICIIVAMPEAKVEHQMWIMTQIQAYTLWVAILPIIILLPFAIAFRLSNSVSSIITFLFFFFGYQGLGYIDMIRRNASIDYTFADIIETIWVISPHIYVADITNRMVFKLGSLPPKTWIFLIIYLLSFGILTLAVSHLILPTQGPGKKTKAKKHVI